MTLENRIERLEKRTGATSRHRDVRELTNDELAVIITGNPDTKASDLTDADLEAVIKGGKNDTRTENYAPGE